MNATSKLQVAANKGKTVWLKELLLKMLPELQQSDTDYQDWFNRLQEVFEARNLITPQQQKNYLVDTRRGIKILDENHPALEIVNFDTETWTEINNHYSNNIATRTSKFIDTPDAIVQKATNLLNSYVWAEIAAGLSVLTGRRCTEVIKTAKFELKSKFSVIFRGSLKRKNEPLECVFEIPTLCEANLVIKAIASLREKLGGEVNNLSNRQTNSRFSKAVATQCERHFKGLVPPREGKDNLYTHLFRSIYGTIACYWYCPPNIPEIEYRAAIQGHYQILDEKNPELRRSLAAGRHYFDYKISDGQGNIDGRLGIKLGFPDIKIIEEFESVYTPEPTPIQKEINPLHTSKVTAKHEKSIMSKSSSDSKNIIIPSFLRPRLETISNQLDISQEETIQELFTWTEVALSLAEELEVEELNPQIMYNSVRSLKQIASDPSSLINSPSSSRDNDTEELARAKQQIASLIKSLEHLTEIWHKADSINDNSASKITSPKKSNSSEIRPINSTKDKLKKSANGENLTAHKPKTSKRTNKTSSSIRRRDDPETVSRDISHAVDAIIEFNDAENREHNQKFYLGIGSIRDLCSRGDIAIRKILKERKEEIEQHLAKHQLAKSHNLSRKNGKGENYPKIKKEKEINYQKITLVQTLN